MKSPLAIWIFGPIGAGKSSIREHLPLGRFQKVDQDAELERLLRTAGLHFDMARYDAAQHQTFLRLRQAAAATTWSAIPGWRAQGRNIVFETTGNKPVHFGAEIDSGHRHGYRTLGCALRVPLSVCLERNRTRERVLSEEIVVSTWHAFEAFIQDGTYRRIFAKDTLEVCDSAEAAITAAREWLGVSGHEGGDQGRCGG